MSSHILMAYEFDGSGSAKAIAQNDISKSINSIKPAWVHLEANNPETKLWLENEFSNLDSFVL